MSLSCPSTVRASLLLLVVTALLPAQKAPVTLESLQDGMRGPASSFAPGRVWHPQGGRFVWIEGSRVMEWTRTSTEAKELFSFEAQEKNPVATVQEKAFGWENRRVQEERLQWSADGKMILLLLKGDLFLWDSTSGKISQLTATSAAEHDPKLSPDGTKVSFRRGFDLYVLEIASKKETRLTLDGSETRLNAMLDWVYPEELDLGTAHWWSPDSRQIAYMQFDIGREHIYGHVDHLPIEAVSEPERYPKAGTPNADVSHRRGECASGGETQWLDLGEPRLYLYPRVTWTPDSRERRGAPAESRAEPPGGASTPIRKSGQARVR